MKPIFLSFAMLFLLANASQALTILNNTGEEVKFRLWIIEKKGNEIFDLISDDVKQGKETSLSISDTDIDKIKEAVEEAVKNHHLVLPLTVNIDSVTPLDTQKTVLTCWYFRKIRTAGVIVPELQTLDALRLEMTKKLHDVNGKPTHCIEIIK